MCKFGTATLERRIQSREGRISLPKVTVALVGPGRWIAYSHSVFEALLVSRPVEWDGFRFPLTTRTQSSPVRVCLCRPRGALLPMNAASKRRRTARRSSTNRVTSKSDGMQGCSIHQTDFINHCKVHFVRSDAWLLILVNTIIVMNCRHGSTNGGVDVEQGMQVQVWNDGRETTTNIDSYICRSDCYGE